MRSVYPKKMRMLEKESENEIERAKKPFLITYRRVIYSSTSFFSLFFTF